MSSRRKLPLFLEFFKLSFFAVIEKEKLVQIIQNEQKSKFVLPHLETDSSPQWLKSLHDYFIDLASKLFKMFPQGSKSFDETTIKTLLIVFLVIAALAIIYLFYKIIKHFVLSGKNKSPLINSAVDIKLDTLEEALQKATHKGKWNLASRIMWKIYLKNRNLNLSMTPLEASQLDRTDFTTYYPLMFSTIADQSHFSNMEKSLRSIL